MQGFSKKNIWKLQMQGCFQKKRNIVCWNLDDQTTKFWCTFLMFRMMQSKLIAAFLKKHGIHTEL